MTENLLYFQAIALLERDERFFASVYAINTLLIKKGVYTQEEFESLFIEWATKERSKKSRSDGVRVITDDNLKNWFTYHKPEADEPAKYEAIREAAHNLAKVIRDNTPPSADQTAAIRFVRQATMTANQSIACKGQ